MTTAQRIKNLEARILELESQVRTLQARPQIVVVPAVAAPAPPTVYPLQPSITPVPTWPTRPYIGDSPYPNPYITWCGASPNQTAYSTA